jgi:hypothetical protein
MLTTGTILLRAQEFLAYIDENPGSSYARDYAIKVNDVRNIREKVLRPPLKFADDQVNLPQQQHLGCRWSRQI